MRVSKPKHDFEIPTICPHCGHKLDTGTLEPHEPDAATAKPKTGDLGVCIECAGFLIYTDDLGNVRALNPKDMDAMDHRLKAELINLRMNIRAMKFKWPPRGSESAPPGVQL